MPPHLCNKVVSENLFFFSPSPLFSLSMINRDCKLQSLFECTFFLVAELISWVASAILHILHVCVTSWDNAMLLSYRGFVLRQHLDHVHTDRLPGAPSKGLPSSCQYFSSLFHEKENYYWEGRGEHHSCPLVDHQLHLVRNIQAQKKTAVPAPCRGLSLPYRHTN